MLTNLLLDLVSPATSSMEQKPQTGYAQGAASINTIIQRKSDSSQKEGTTFTDVSEKAETLTAEVEEVKK